MLGLANKNLLHLVLHYVFLLLELTELQVYLLLQLHLLLLM
jgi:hypothetical protein